MYPEYATGQDPSAPKSKATELEGVIAHLERILNTAVEVRDRIQRTNMRLTPGGCVDGESNKERPSRTGLLGNINDLLDDLDRIQQSQTSELSLLSNTI